jgi:hypothetical protein
MFAFVKNLVSAGNRLVKNLRAMADSVEELNTALRQATGLDRPEKARKVLEHRAAGNGKDGAN